MIQTIFFDFGGCLDSGGVHTRTLFWQAITKTCEDKLGQEAKLRFDSAYTQADQEMMEQGLAIGLCLKDFNQLNARLILEKMDFLKKPKKKELEGYVKAVADQVSKIQDQHLRENKKILLELKEKYLLGVISNFTGNLESILREYGLREIFHTVTESYYVKSAKPDPEIFFEALRMQPNPSGSCVYIGDNPRNDISPARSLGMKTILIYEKGKKESCGADAYIESLLELPALIQMM